MTKFKQYKKILKIGFLLIILMGIPFSCGHDDLSIQNNQNNIEDITKLSEDKLLLKIIESNLSVIENISDINKIQQLTSKNYILSKKELNELSILIGFKNFKTYKEFYTVQKRDMITLIKKYNLSNYSKDELLSLISKNYFLTLENKSGNNCERIRRNCLGIALSGAIVGHLACASLDLAIVPGIICHAAVSAGQAFASDNCNAEAEDCEKK